MTDPDTLAAEVLRLAPAEAAEVLRELLLDADLRAGAASAGADLDERVTRDVAFLREVVAEVGYPGERPDTASPQELLAALVEAIPAVREPAAEALAAFTDRETSLDVAASIGIASIVIASSAAIIRPLVNFEHERDGDRATTKLKIDVRGTRGLGEVIRALLPFLPPGNADGRP